MSHAAPSSRPARTPRPARTYTALALSGLVILPTLLAAGVSTQAEAAGPQAAGASTAVTVSGTGRFADLKVTVDQTQNLVNQAVTVSWSGAPQTLVNGAGSALGNYLQLMQCWAAPGQQPTREQCQFGGYVDVPDGAANIASRQMSQPAVDPDETVYVKKDPSDFTLKYVEFHGIDGTVEKDRRSQFFDASTTNEIPIARTAADGTGQSSFEMQTGLEAPGLGCGQNINGVTPDCFLVVVPRDLVEVTGVTVGTQSSDALTTSPLSTSNWRNRLVVPLSFQTIGGACSFGRPETPTYGSDFVAEAITAWQPELCGLGPRNFGFTSLSDDTTRNQLASDDPGLAFVNRSVPSVPGAVYAPVAISAMTFVANVDRQMPVRDPNGRPIGNPETIPVDIRGKVGSRIDSVKLTPRLIAKLLTQSYSFDRAIGTATNLVANPFDISRDPDFLALNPAFKPSGYTVLIGGGLGRILVNAGLSDSADLLWRYVLSDQEARDFLAGKPDPWGMVLNEKYRGLTLPTNSFPRADLGCAVPGNAPPGFDLANCTLDVFPFANGFNAAARAVSRGDINRRDVPRQAEVNSYGLEPNQVPGQRSMLGLSDSASAARYRQVTVELKNAAGNFVAPTTATMSAAVSSMGPDPQGVLLDAITTVTKDAYPLTVVTYAATNPAALSETEKADYSALLGYVAAQGQVAGNEPGQLPDGYVPLPATLRTRTALAAAQIASYVAPTPTPTPTPTDSETPTPTTEPVVPPVDTGSGDGGVVPTTGEPSSTASASPSAAPTSTPSTTPVAASGVTPADPAGASRLALVTALVLGIAALLARVVLPWIVPRS